jgi:hypothetical protein
MFDCDVLADHDYEIISDTKEKFVVSHNKTGSVVCFERNSLDETELWNLHYEVNGNTNLIHGKTKGMISFYSFLTSLVGYFILVKQPDELKTIVNSKTEVKDSRKRINDYIFNKFEQRLSEVGYSHTKTEIPGMNSRLYVIRKSQ